jgi:putative transposase
MRKLRSHYTIPFMCSMSNLSSSGYYAWLTRKPSKRVQEEGRLEVEIRAAHKRTREVCGPETLQHDLREHGVKVGVHRIRRISKKLGIRCKQKRKFRATTDSTHTLPVAKNLLNQQFTTTAPGRVWVSDITYVPTQEGWLYLAGHKDLFTGEVVGYAMGPRMTKNLIMQSLLKAVAAKRPGPDLVHHSDRGSQYCSHEYRKMLDQFGMTASMSRRGNCYDNAPMESFWGILKSELTHHRHYKTRQEAIREISEHIEVFYNRLRRQRRLGYLSPAAYERRYYAKKAAA